MITAVGISSSIPVIADVVNVSVSDFCDNNNESANVSVPVYIFSYSHIDT